MTNLETFILTILLVENGLLLGGWWLWRQRHCVKCQKMKSLDQIFNQLCANCQSKPEKSEMF